MKIFGSGFKWLLLLLFFTASGELRPQELTSESKSNVVNRISNLLVENYVFPETGKDCGEHLKNKLKAGVFDNINDIKEFAAALTGELQSVSKDKHMKVRKEERSTVTGETDPILRGFLSRMQSKKDNSGFVKAEYLEGGVGYLDIRYFAPLLTVKKTAESTMNFLSNSDAIIIDLRNNGGGSPDIISYISSYFFDKPTHLNSLYYRRGDRTEEYWTQKIEGSTLAGVPLFILTSSRTFSGGEEFANNFKTQRRAEIIGETTGGGANPGEMFRINEELAIFIPTGRAINPVTQTNWEGVGVEPDIKISAEEAFDLALEKAKTAAEEYRKIKINHARELSETINGKLLEAEELIVKDKTRSELLIEEALMEGLGGGLLNEDLINMKGYDYLFNDKPAMAIEVFRFNVKNFPDSFNTYDSLGEAYMNIRQNDLAVSNYKKSLELNPENKNAEEMIKKINTGNKEN